MIIVKLFTALVLLLLINYIIDNKTIGEIWSKIHVNSLIGFQKLIEQSKLQSLSEVEIWYNIFIHVLNIPVLFPLVIIIILLLLLKLIKKLIYLT